MGTSTLPVTHPSRRRSAPPQDEVFVGRSSNALILGSDRLARRAVKWLRASAYQLVDREDLRRDALGQSIDAAETDRLIARLEQGGVGNARHWTPLFPERAEIHALDCRKAIGRAVATYTSLHKSQLG